MTESSGIIDDESDSGIPQPTKDLVNERHPQSLDKLQRESREIHRAVLTKCLLDSYPDATTASDLGKRSEIGPDTVKKHLSEMEKAGIVAKMDHSWRLEGSVLYRFNQNKRLHGEIFQPLATLKPENCNVVIIRAEGDDIEVKAMNPETTIYQNAGTGQLTGTIIARNALSDSISLQVRPRHTNSSGLLRRLDFAALDIDTRFAAYANVVRL
jgi:DNA-binding transcriptional ArsR family regulator